MPKLVVGEHVELDEVEESQDFKDSLEAEYEKLIDSVRQYNPKADFDLIRRAFDFSREAHYGQKRLTGEPYITHPLATAQNLARVQMDAESLAAGLLHDVVEDSKVTIETIEKEFGEEVMRLVDGVTNLKLADFERREGDVETDAKKRRRELRENAKNLRSIFLAVARDLRVMMIKLADRLHNMSTLEGLKPERRVKVASETLQIYAPLAHRLGVWEIKWRLEDLAFKHLEPEKYEEIVEKVNRSRAERENDIREAVKMLEEKLKRAGIECEIHGRPKHLWSIYQKMLKEHLTFDQIFDLIAIRVIVNTVDECYTTLGIVHNLWLQIPGRFDDYIARAKPNLYQSLHTKVLGPRGEPLEIQIRTWKMHRTAEFGVAAHWQYKEQTSGSDSDRKLQWLRQQLVEWQSESKDDTDFLRSVINDLFTDQVFVFTPTGDVINLPTGSTPLDFAYRIHSDLGHHCVAAKVNGRIVPLSHKLSNGAIVQVITRPNAAPSLDWLNQTVTSHARHKIKAYFRRLDFSDSVLRGREMLEREMERQSVDKALLKGDALGKLASHFNKASEDDLLAAIGFGHLGANALVHKLAPPEQAERKLTQQRPVTEGKVQVEGAEDMLTSRAQCCLPLPGDEVVGYVSRGKGVVLHRGSCSNIAQYQEVEPDRLMQVEWGRPGGRYSSQLRIESLDRMGLLNDISAIFSELKVNILSGRMSTNKAKRAIFDLTIEVEDLAQLEMISTTLTRLSDVLQVYRVGGTSPGKGAAAESE